MHKHTEDDNEMRPAKLYSAEEIGELLGVSARMVLMMPIRQIKLGPRTIRFCLDDVYRHFDIDNPNA